MADISKITLPSGNTYNLKDAVARQAISGGVTFIIAVDAGTTPEGIVWNNGSSNITGTLKASAAQTGAFYLVKSAHSSSDANDVYDEYVVITADEAKRWEKLGDTTITDVTTTTQSVLSGITVQNAPSNVSFGTPITDNALGEDTTFKNAASAVSITPTTTDVVTSVKSAGSAGKMAAIDTTKFNGGSLSAGSFSGGSGSFTQGTDIYKTTSYSVSDENLTITAGNFVQGKDIHTHVAATHTQGTLTPASLGTGFYTAGVAPTMPTFNTGTAWNGYSAATAAAQAITVGTNDKVAAVTTMPTATAAAQTPTVTPSKVDVIKTVSVTK